MDDVLVGLLALVLGAAVCFLGLRIWFVLLPIWGFIAGFFLGADFVTAAFGDGFLSTVTGWIIGIVVGIALAVLSYFIWYAGAIIVAASVGALIGSGLMRAFDVNTDWVVFIVALAGAILFGLIALLINFPVYIVIINTALAGAVAAVTGAMLILNRIDLDELENGPAWAFISESWFWVLVWIVVAALGMGYQLTTLEEAAFPEDRWTRSRQSYAV
jgi:hypothetical protein